MEGKKFYGLMGNASHFLKRLTLLSSSNHGWTEIYIDSNTGNQWLKYMIDRDNGLYYNLMLISPKTTTDEMIELAFTSADMDEVEGAVHRLFIEEHDQKIEFRSKLMQRLKKIDIQTLHSEEKERIKIIINNGHLIERINKREMVGKHHSENEIDVAFFNEVAETAEKILKQI